MADLPITLSFKTTVAMDAWLRELARLEQRKLGDMIRILLSSIMEMEIEQGGEKREV